MLTNIAGQTAEMPHNVGYGGSKPNTKLQFKILHVLGTLNPGGVETWLVHVLKSIDRDRFQFYFCTLGTEAGVYAPEVERLGAKVLRCPVPRNFFAMSRRFRQLLRNGSFDAVHSHVHLFSGAILRCARMERVPIRIAHSHTTRDDGCDRHFRRWYRSLMTLWIRSYATHGLAASQEAASELFGEDWWVDGRFRVVHYGIDLGAFRDHVNVEDVRKTLDIPPRVPVIAQVGSFILRKNHRFFMEIIGHIARKRPEIHYLLVGDGPLRATIEAEAMQMRLSENIHFIGMRTDVPKLMCGCIDALVLPSLWEGLPITLLESQAAGLRCVVSDTITEEATIVPEQVVRLSLSQGADEWAARAIESVNCGKIDRSLPLRVMAQSDFCVHKSAEILSRLYAASPS